MATASVVEDLDVVRDRESCSGVGGEHLLVVHLVLQAREERFGGSVVPAHPGAAHRLAKPVRLAVAVNAPALHWAPWSEWKIAPGRALPWMRAISRASMTRLAHMLGDLPADHYAGSQIDHGDEVEPSFTGA